MNILLLSILLSISPFLELRAGIPFAISMGVTPFLAFLVCVISNILVIIPIFIFLDTINNQFLKIKIYNKLFNKYIKYARTKAKKKIVTYGTFLALFLLVAVPLPGTGAYTGTLVAFLFGFKRKKSFLVMSLGVLTAGIIVTLISQGIINFIS